MKLDPYKDSYEKLASIDPVKYQATRNYIPNSLKLKKEISEELINSNIIFFKNEMMDIKLHKESTFVILGGLTAYYFDTYFIILKCKSKEQLSFLHIYHHSTIGLIWGFLIHNGVGNGTAAYGCFINSIIHFIM